MAPTGFMPNVSGNRMEMVAIGPMPGNTPTMLPISTPTKHHMILCGSNATPNPYHKSVNAVSITPDPNSRAKAECAVPADAAAQTDLSIRLQNARPPA